MWFYIAQIFGFISFIILLFSFWQNNRQKLLLYQMINGILFAVQYALLGGVTGALVNLAGFFRALLFQKFTNFLILFIFVIVYIAICFFTYDGYVSLFPVIASLIYTFGLTKKSNNKIRITAIICSFFWLLYNFLVMAYVSFFSEFVLLASNIIALYKLDIKK